MRAPLAWGWSIDPSPEPRAGAGTYVLMLENWGTAVVVGTAIVVGAVNMSEDGSWRRGAAAAWAEVEVLEGVVGDARLTAHDCGGACRTQCVRCDAGALRSVCTGLSAVGLLEGARCSIAPTSDCMSDAGVSTANKQHINGLVLCFGGRLIN
jgi:hypothetical protein